MHYSVMPASPMQQKSLVGAALHPHHPAPWDRAWRSLAISQVEKFRAG